MAGHNQRKPSTLTFHRQTLLLPETREHLMKMYENWKAFISWCYFSAALEAKSQPSAQEMPLGGCQVTSCPLSLYAVLRQEGTELRD